MPLSDELNIERHAQLLDYLRGRDHIAPQENPTFETLRGGVSNRTVRVQFEQRPNWVLKQALRKLRVEVDWHSAPERIQREAAGLVWLGRIIPCHVPKFVFLDQAHHILAMTAVPQPHENWKSALLAGRSDIDHARAFGRLLAQIHSAAGQFPELAQDFAERRFFEELRLEPYYSFTARQIPAAGRFLTQLIEATRRRRHALAHGDYSPKNVLIHSDKLVILDFEVTHFGDPAFDIGFSLTHFLSKAHYLPPRRAAFLAMAREYWRSYLAGIAPELREVVLPFALPHTLACLLARVAGRSPLEYLDASHRTRQTRIVLDLLSQNIAEIPQVIQSFGEMIGHDDERN